MRENSPEQNLFRDDALTFASQRSFGQVKTTQPVSYKAFTVLLIVMTSIAFSYLWFGEYSRKQTVLGYLAPDKGLVNVYPQDDAAIVAEVHVREGQIVARGDPLVLLSYANQMPQDGDALSKVIAELLHQKEQIQHQIIRLGENHQRERQRLKLRIVEQSADLRQERTAYQLQLGQVQVAKKLLSSLQVLRNTGAISEFRQLQAVSDTLAQEKELANVSRRILQIQSATRSLQYEERQLPSVQQEQMLNTRIQLSSIKQKITEVKSRQNLLLTATVDGRVTALQAKIGAPARARTSLLSMVPTGSLLESKLLIPSTAIGFVEIGQSIRLLFDAYPHEQYGSYPAKITSVSSAPVNPQALQAPLRPDGPVFLVRAELGKQTIMAMGEERQLQTGMLLKADIIFEKRSLVKWLLEPLYSLRGR